MQSALCKSEQGACKRSYTYDEMTRTCYYTALHANRWLSVKLAKLWHSPLDEATAASFPCARALSLRRQKGTSLKTEQAAAACKAVRASTPSEQQEPESQAHLSCRDGTRNQGTVGCCCWQALACWRWPPLRPVAI